MAPGGCLIRLGASVPATSPDRVLWVSIPWEDGCAGPAALVPAAWVNCGRRCGATQVGPPNPAAQTGLGTAQPSRPPDGSEPEPGHACQSISRLAPRDQPAGRAARTERLAGVIGSWWRGRSPAIADGVIRQPRRQSMPATQRAACSPTDRHPAANQPAAACSPTNRPPSARQRPARLLANPPACQPARSPTNHRLLANRPACQPPANQPPAARRLTNYRPLANRPPINQPPARQPTGRRPLASSQPACPPTTCSPTNRPPAARQLPPANQPPPARQPIRRRPLANGHLPAPSTVCPSIPFVPRIPHLRR